MEQEKITKIIASLELTLVMLSIFSFTYILDQNSGGFRDVEAETRAYREQSVSTFEAIIATLVSRMKQPMIPLVSAEETPIGCCETNILGEQCSTTTKDNCEEQFLQGALCSETSFCRKGCCYNEDEGIFDNNVLQKDCTTEDFAWNVNYPNCQFPDGKAKKGCCILGTTTKFETYGACKTDTEVLALGIDSTVNWRGDLNEYECLLEVTNFKEGACVFNEENCKFGTKEQCDGLQGAFYEGYLCTAEQLDTACEKTTTTSCVNNKDAVYFLDSCGNPANIYDSTKIYDQNYWEMVVKPQDSCGGRNEDGSANSGSCGNCDRFLGGICTPAQEDNFEPDFGDHYCRQTSCEFEGEWGTEYYENGESWCVYDGVIGEGNDVPGSKHWRYQCNYGKAEIAGCSEGRGEVCVQTKELTDSDGNSVSWNNAACVINNALSCYDITGNNDNPGWRQDCEDALHCRVHNVYVDEYFQFDACLPEYPRGFDFKGEDGRTSNDAICGYGTNTCTVYYEAKFWGGCELAGNGNCLTQDFAKQMNEYCRKLGDCGNEPNWNGDYTENIRMRKDGQLMPKPYFGNAWKNMLISMATPIKGEYAQMEDYSEYMETLGLLADSPELNDGSGVTDTLQTLGYGLGGLGVAAGAALSAEAGLIIGEGGLGLLGEVGSAGSLGAASFANVAIGAAVGMFIGLWIADMVGASPGGTLLLAVGGAMVGGAAMAVYSGLIAIFPAGTIIAAIGLILMIIGSLLTSDCENIEIQFQCNSWQPPRGGTGCEVCNEDENKPCSKHRCEALGQACTFLPDSGLCFHDRADDVVPPVITYSEELEERQKIQSTNTGTGISISSETGSCLDPEENNPLLIKIITDEPASCAWDLQPLLFEEMSGQILPTGPVYQHTMIFPLYDPSYGESQGTDVTEDIKAYIKCLDTHGTASRDYFTIDFCLKQGEDTRPPIITGIEPTSGSLISFDATEQDVTVYTKAPADCKWSFNDESYENMENTMECADSVQDMNTIRGYECTGTVQTPETANLYYFRCLDQPWLEGTEDENKRNANQQSQPPEGLLLRKPENKIEITNVKPEGYFETGVALNPIVLEITTEQGGEWHKCSFSFTGYETMIELWETGGAGLHQQPLNIPAGEHTIYVECYDETGDTAQGETSFTIFHDQANPLVARIWQNQGTLYFITTEEAECKYSLQGCNFDFEEGQDAGTGIQHTISTTRGDTYSIKCKDEFGNVPNACSIKVTTP